MGQGRTSSRAHVVEQLGELGFLGVAFPEKYGGGGADTLSQVLVVEGISRYDAGVGLSCAAHMSLSSGHIGLFASEALKAQYLPDMLAAKKIGAWCLTEPESGSDAAAMRTKAVRTGDNYRIDGAKMFITNGGVADVYVVMAVTDGGAGRSGVSAFIVDRGTPGLSNGRKIEKLGLHSSDTAEVVFENVTVPARNLIGDLGAGYQQTLKVLEGGRIGIAGFAIGIARGAMEDAAAYAKERRQFGKAIADFQAIQWMIADMATRIEASWLLMLRAAALRITASRSPAKPRWRNFTPRKPRCGRRPRPCRSSAATATSRNFRSSATCATPSSPKSARAPAKCSA